MAPEVVLRKLSVLRQLLADLEPHADADLAAVRAEHYEIERILELLTTAAADLVSHLLAEQGEPPTSYRETFRRAGQKGLIPEDLAARLEEAAAMRNVLVHLYQDIDLETVRESIPEALRDFRLLVGHLEPHA